jgi:hypothetical protein
MTITFLVAINTDDVSPTTLEALAGDIEEDLIRSGMDVDSVKPWQRSSLGLQMPMDQQTLAPNPQPPAPPSLLG